MKKRVLITNVHMGIGGIETSLIELLNRLDYRKYKVELFLMKKTGENILKIPKEVKVYSIHEISVLKKIKILFCDNIVSKIIRKVFYRGLFIKNFIPNKKYDIGLAFGGYNKFMDEIVSRANCSKKYIWVHTNVKTLFALNSKAKKIFFEKKYENFDKILNVSNDCLKCFVEVFPKLSNKSDFIWNFPVLGKPLKEKKKLLPKGFNIISVGRLVQQKNFQLLIEIHKKLIDKKIDVKTHIIGDGEDYNMLKAKIEELRVSDTFTLLGRKTNVLNYMQQADLYVGCSHYEGLSLVLIEALCTGIPIVANDVSGHHEALTEIAPQGSSLLVENNMNSLIDGIIRAMNGEIKKGYKFDKKIMEKKIFDKLNKILEGTL